MSLLIKFRLLCLFFSFTSVSLAGAKAINSQVKLMVKTNKPSALYKIGEPIVFEVTLTENGKALVGTKIKYSILKGLRWKGGSIISSNKAMTIKTSLDKPGFVMCQVSCLPSKGKTRRIYKYAGAGVEPLKIKGAGPEPEDFDKFWNSKKAMLKKIPLEPTLTPLKVASRYKKNVVCYDLKINCPGGAPVSGYFFKPKNAKIKSLPAVIKFHGAGVRSSTKPYAMAAKGVLAMDINAHGIDNGKPKDYYMKLRNGKYKEYYYKNSDDKEKMYFLGMFLRVYRSLQFAMAQPEWDGKNLIVTGHSQGGAQAIVAAGLEPKVSLCIAKEPALCNHLGILHNRKSGWPHFIREARKHKPFNQNVTKTIPYFDVANFAKRIKGEAVITVGFIDRLCYPSSVYAAYNNIQGEKTIINDPTAEHRKTKKPETACNKIINEYINYKK